MGRSQLGHEVSLLDGETREVALEVEMGRSRVCRVVVQGHKEEVEKTIDIKCNIIYNVCIIKIHTLK